jgi:thiamine kinase-like enzyme
LLHLDAHAGNVLATDELCLLDWEYAHLGDPLWDLASLTAPLPLDRALGVVLLRAAGREADSTWEQLRNASELCRLLHELWQLEQ